MRRALGFQGPLSGPFQWLGEGLVRALGAALATDASLELQVADSAGGPEAAQEAATALARSADVLAVVGPTFSREADASGSVLEAAGLAFVLPVATKPELGEHGWLGFHRIVATDRLRAPSVADLFADVLGANRPALICERTETGERVAELVSASLHARGCPVVARASFARGSAADELDIGPLLESQPDAIYFGGEYADAAAVCSHARERRPGIPVVSDESIRTPAFIDAAGREAAEGVIVVAPSAPASQADESATSVDAARDRYEPVVFSTEAFQAGLLLAQTLAQCPPERSSVREALRAVHDVVAGREIAFTESGENLYARFYAYRVVDGAWVAWKDLPSGPELTARTHQTA